MTDPVFIHPIPPTVASGKILQLTGAEAKHAEVKRMRDGENVNITDGHTRAVRGQWIGDAVHVTEVMDLRALAQPRPTVTVVQAIPKSDRAELAVDLLVQAGVDCIVPWQSARCIARWDGKEHKARAKWEHAARAAAKQSRRLVVPPVTPLLRHVSELPELIRGTQHPGLTEFPETLPNGALSIGVLHEEAAMPLRKLNLDMPHVVLFIGPEGGVAPTEITALEQLGAQPVILGPQVLRTAAAGAVALGAIGALTPRWR